MTIPLLDYSPSTQNQRVAGYEVPGDEQPKIYSMENLPSAGEIEDAIAMAYRQVFNEQQLLASNRQTFLESQLRFGQIVMRDFIRGLVLSEPFRRRNYETNNNYRFVRMCVQRVLGRDVYTKREELAWSTLLATKGLEGFIDTLLDSEEYMGNFGYDTIPYQRRRILPQRTEGDLPFARMPRYGEDHRQQLIALGYFSDQMKYYPWMDTTPYYPPKPVLLAAKIITMAGATVLTLGTIAVALAAWGLISL